MSKRFLGIFVNPIYVQNEGLDAVFDNLEALGVNAICTVPKVALPSSAGGRRYPDLHMDGYERLLARPVWGEQEINVDSYLAFEPDLNLYEVAGYQPSYSSLPPGLDPSIPQTMIAEAHRRGMQAHMLFHPTLLPNIQPSEQPAYIDGTTPKPPQITLNGCLNNPKVQAYGLALAQDIAQHYPDLDGLFPDWTEYGAYRLQDHFTCICSHCEQAARKQGYDWDSITRDVRSLWDWLHELMSKSLEISRRVVSNPSEILELLGHYPGWLQFLQFKAGTVVGFYQQMRKQLDVLGHDEMTLSARGWPPPWNRSSGMDYRALAQVCATITPKLFLFDYSALPRWYGQTLLDWNPDLPESIVLDALVTWMNLPDDIDHRSFFHYQIPAPDQRHTAHLDVYRSRVDEVIAQVGDQSLVYPFAHAYLPDAQWKHIIAILRDSSVDGIWVQMYGYLSNHKMNILKQMWM